MSAPMADAPPGTAPRRREAAMPFILFTALIDMVSISTVTRMKGIAAREGSGVAAAEGTEVKRPGQRRAAPKRPERPSGLASGASWGLSLIPSGSSALPW